MHKLKFYWNILSQDFRVTLISTSIFPIIDCCSIVYQGFTNEQDLKLQRLINCWILSIFDLRRDVHITPFRHQLGWLSVCGRRNYFLGIAMFNLTPRIANHYILEMFYCPPFGGHWPDGQLMMFWSSRMFVNRNYAMNWIETKLIRKIGSELCNKVSLTIQIDNSFLRIINRKIQFQYIGVPILSSLSRLKKLLLKYLASSHFRVSWYSILPYRATLLSFLLSVMT